MEKSGLERRDNHSPAFDPYRTEDRVNRIMDGATNIA